MQRLALFSARASLLLSLFFTILLLLALLAAQVHSAERAKLTIGYSTTGPTAVGLWMAKEIGAFGKYGVEPNFIFISSSPVMVPAPIGGDVQCAIAGATAVIAAVLATLRTDVPHRILVELAESGIQYSMGQLVVARQFQRRSPDTLEKILRAYIEGVAALRDAAQKERVAKTIGNVTRLKESKAIEEIYSDAAKYVDRIPRVEPEAVAATLAQMGKKGLAIETFTDNSIIDRLVREGFVEQVYKKR
jgi:ABC-type nitrate/sulfonate/bicarbonate transport system substrate-binding protein